MSKAVSYDDLEYLPDGTFLLNGKPFTGATVDFDDKGQRIAESHFTNGRQNGTTMLWHSNGRLECEVNYVDSAKHGIERRWFENGDLKSTTVFEFGFTMKHEVRDQNQVVIESFERKPTDAFYQIVLKKRAAAATKSDPLPNTTK